MKQLLENWGHFTEEVETLEELLVHGSLNDTNAPNINVIAHGKDLWVMRELPPRESPERERLFKQLSNALDVELDPESPWYDILGDIAYHTDDFENRSDVLFADLHKDSMTLLIHGSFDTFKFDPRSSLLVKKVVDTLGVRNVTYMQGANDDEVEVHGSEVKGEMPTIAFHGTTITYLRSIFKFGLAPGISETNYEGVVHKKAVFFSTRFDEALHHAVHTAEKMGGHPVVLGLRVPDKSLLIPDYDVDVGAGDTGCFDYICSKLRDRQKEHSKTMKQKSMTLSKEFGMYGYKGRIPANHIKSYYILMNPAENDIDVWHSSKEDFTRMNQKQASIYIDTFEEFDHGFMEYPEFDDEEDEE